MVGTVSTVAKLVYIPVITLATMTSGNVHIHCTILFPPPPSPLLSSLTLHLTTVTVSPLSPVPLPPHLTSPPSPLLPLPPHLSSRYNHSVSNL